MHKPFTQPHRHRHRWMHTLQQGHFGHQCVQRCWIFGLETALGATSNNAPHQTVVNRIWWVCRYFYSLTHLPSEERSLLTEDKLEKRPAVHCHCLSDDAECGYWRKQNKREKQSAKVQKKERFFFSIFNLESLVLHAQNRHARFW